MKRNRLGEPSAGAGRLGRRLATLLSLMVFNGSVVFGSTPARWLGSVVCLALIALWWLPLPRWRRR